MFRNTAIYIFLFLSGSLPVIAASGDPTVADSAYQSHCGFIDADSVAVYIENLHTGEVVLDVFGEAPMCPASVTKILTAATAFRRLPIDSCFTTGFTLQGKQSGGVFKGNLIVDASGDPTLESAYFPEYAGVADSVAKAIKKLGIKRIDGEIKFRYPACLEEDVPEGWKGNDLAWPYGTGHHGVNFADNRTTLTFDRKGVATFNPPVAGAAVRRGATGNGEQIRRDRGSKTFIVDYRGRKPLTRQVANPSPQASFSGAIAASFEADSIEMTFRPHKSGKRDAIVPVYEHRSPPYVRIIESLVRRSDNMMAEAMLRHSFPGLSRREAVRSELDMWNRLGVNLDGVELEDGSGLSRRNRLPAYTIADILVWMADNEPQFLPFLNTFPKAGETGTVRKFLKDTPLQGRLRLKSGSVNGVQCYAGYSVDAADLPVHVVVVMVNGFHVPRATLKKQIETLLLEKIL